MKRVVAAVDAYVAKNKKPSLSTEQENKIIGERNNLIRLFENYFLNASARASIKAQINVEFKKLNAELRK